MKLAQAVRSGGFYVIPISSAYIGLQVLYVIMMYVSVYLVVITMRHSNVYEERSLGIYRRDSRSKSTCDAAIYPTRERNHHRSSSISKALGRAVTTWNLGRRCYKPCSEESHTSFISQQIRGQLAHDLWLLVLAVLFIMVIETDHWLTDPVTFSVFNVIFEVVSAYGTVGISVGLPKDAFSFSGGWHTGSKLILCVVMLRGRHRGLPVALDRAVRLPGEQLHLDEEEDHRIRRTITGRRVSLEV
jgi:Trk-type K+ transport system membrane component